ncbi:AT-hook motif nuclear-localized protein 14-like [Primulina huaijiensis]|uniref:AT-hook motif nuclear-localized protein 14-like n=1 Tax=Primulina huaijiensis TaxID=1492673 RepID=UPI003CC77814
MEFNNNDGSSSGFITYYHPQLRHQTTPPPPPSAAAPAPTNGVVVSNSNPGSILYPHSVPSSAVSSSLEGVKRKRGRPRKYGTPEQAAAAKRLSASASSASPRTRDSASAAGPGVPTSGSSAYSSKKSQLAALGNVGQSFSPHIVTVAAGEDVNQKIMMFMQQNQREVCIISASGSVSNASLRQPATSGGSVTYEGHFDILSLSGSYIRTETGGKTGGLGVCLSSSDGQIIGGGVGGPLTAAGPIQIIIGTFLTDSKKDTKGDASSGKLPSPANLTSIPSLNFRSPVEATHQMGLGSQFLVQHPSMQFTPSHSVEWKGNTGHHGLHQSPENGDYDHISD